MVIHHPKPEHRDDLTRSMVERAELMAATPVSSKPARGRLRDDERIVGIARWESREAFLEAVPLGFGAPTTEVHEWETRPREIFHLESRPSTQSAQGSRHSRLEVTR